MSNTNNIDAEVFVKASAQTMEELIRDNNLTVDDILRILGIVASCEYHEKNLEVTDIEAIERFSKLVSDFR